MDASQPSVSELFARALENGASVVTTTTTTTTTTHQAVARNFKTRACSRKKLGRCAGRVPIDSPYKQCERCRERGRRHSKNDKRKASYRKYRDGDKFKAWKEEYINSEDGKASIKRNRDKQNAKLMNQLSNSLCKMVRGTHRGPASIPKLGCFKDNADATAHFVSTFDTTWMTLENHGKLKSDMGYKEVWHIGHRIPRKIYDETKRGDLKRCWSKANLYAQCARENHENSDKLVLTDAQLLALRAVWPLRALNDLATLKSLYRTIDVASPSKAYETSEPSDSESEADDESSDDDKTENTEPSAIHSHAQLCKPSGKNFPQAPSQKNSFGCAIPTTSKATRASMMTSMAEASSDSDNSDDDQPKASKPAATNGKPANGSAAPKKTAVQKGDSESEEEFEEEADGPPSHLKVVPTPDVEDPPADDAPQEEEAEEEATAPEEVREHVKERYASEKPDDEADAEASNEPASGSESEAGSIKTTLGREIHSPADLDKDTRLARERGLQLEEQTSMGQTASKEDKAAKKGRKGGGAQPRSPANKRTKTVPSVELNGHIDDAATTRTMITRVGTKVGIFATIPNSALVHRRIRSEEGERVVPVKVPISVDKEKGPRRKTAINTLVTNMSDEERKALVNAVIIVEAQTGRRKGESIELKPAFGAYLWVELTGTESEVAKERSFTGTADTLFLLSHDNVVHMRDVARSLNVLPSCLWPEENKLTYAAIAAGTMTEIEGSGWKYFNEGAPPAPTRGRASSSKTKKASKSAEAGAAAEHDEPASGEDSEDEMEVEHDEEGAAGAGSYDSERIEYLKTVAMNQSKRSSPSEEIHIDIKQSMPSVNIATTNGPPECKRMRIDITYY